MAEQGWPLLYDASRLCTRILNPTPNGIDRLDALLARALLGAGDFASSALVFGWGGPRLLPSHQGLAALDRAERVWRENDQSGGTALAEIVAWLRGESDAENAPRPDRIVEPRPGRIGTVVRSLRSLGLRRGGDPERIAPRGAVYLNATHFPLDWPSHVAWLDRRSDVRLVMLVHDLLPLDRPEFFWAGEADRHRRRLALLARRGAGAIVTTASVASRLRDEMALAGRRDFPIRDALPPVAPVFHLRRPCDPRIETANYFLTCGTIEPRKNHRLLLRVWRRLVGRYGRSAPKLVVVGKRGWLCDEIVAEMRDPVLSDHVLEVSGLTSGDYKTLLDHARALLAPSFAEGFGLPIAEALTSGVPVIASDLAVFREQGERSLTLIDPNADDQWQEAVVDFSTLAPRLQVKTGHGETYRPVSPRAYLADVSAFLRDLA